MRHAILGFITSNVISREDKKKYENIFCKLDTDNDGSLSRKEIMDGAENFLEGSNCVNIMNETDLNQFLDLADVNGDGEISQNEFLKAAMSFEQLTSDENFKQAFKLFDENGDNRISPEELAQTLSFVQGMNKEKAIKIVAQYDQNGDGYLQYDEFKEMMTKDLS